MLRVSALLAAACALACDDVALLTPAAAGDGQADNSLDGGVANEDAGIPDVDGGVTDEDAGIPDVDGGVADDDAGVPEVDAGPQPTPDPPNPPACEVVFDETTHICEGDEDACEPIGDLGVARYDVLAVWSRIDDESFVVQVLFRGMPFYCRGQLGLIVNRSGVNTPEFRICGGTDQACASGEFFVELPSRHTADGTGRTLYPPFDITIVHSLDQPISFEFLRGPIRFARDGHLVELTVPLTLVSSDGAAPDYTLYLNYSGDVSAGDESMALGGPSAGGRADVDDEEFWSVVTEEACLVDPELGCGG